MSIVFYTLGVLKINSKSIGYIILGSLCIRLLFFSDFYFHSWDERFHALVAKNTAQNFLKPTLYKLPILWYDFKDWTSNHVWIHKPPIPIWIAALSIKFLGNEIYAFRLPFFFISVTSVYLFYKLVVTFFGNKIAIFSTILFSINGLILDIASCRWATDIIDTTFLFFFLLFLYILFVLRNTNKTLVSLLLGINISVLILTKWLIGLYPFIILLLLKNRFKIKDVLLILLIALPLPLFWNGYCYINYNKEFIHEQLGFLTHINTDIENHGEPWYYYFSKIGQNWNEFSYLSLTLVFLRIKRTNIRLLFLIFLFTFPIILFSLSRTKMPGYMIIAGPTLFVLNSIIYRTLSIKFNRNLWLRSLIFVIFFGLPVRYFFERLKKHENTLPPTNYPNTVSLNKFTKKDVFHNCKDYYIDIMYFSKSTAYKNELSINQIDSLKKLGFKTYNFDKINTIRIDVVN